MMKNGEPYQTLTRMVEKRAQPATPRNGKQSLIWYAETTFGPNDPKTERFKDMVETVERVVDYRNAVEHPEGHSGTLKIRNFRLDPNGKFSVPAWWIERDGHGRR